MRNSGYLNHVPIHIRQEAVRKFFHLIASGDKVGAKKNDNVDFKDVISAWRVPDFVLGPNVPDPPTLYIENLLSRVRFDDELTDDDHKQIIGHMMGLLTQVTDLAETPGRVSSMTSILEAAKGGKEVHYRDLMKAWQSST